MAIYLNTKRQKQNYEELYNSKYFVDKSLIIERLNEVIGTSDKYICITKPRRFGKSSVADMIGAYYSKAVNSKMIFNNLKISKSEEYEKHLNSYNVINISFNQTSNKGKTYKDYIEMIETTIINDVVEKYPHIKAEKYFTLSDMLYDTEEKFIFIFDEWDYIFNNNLFKESQNNFLEFLRQLLKGQPYVALAYMTGVLPIKKYSSTSALNMFDEYTMLNDTLYGEYFGFTENEVEELCEKQEKVKFVEISEWYNGYINENEEKIYNPRSVVKALQNGKCISYWTNTGAMAEVKRYLKYNTMEIREEVIEMVSGETIDIIIDEEYRAGQEEPKTKEEIYSAMIILGFLSYHEGYLKIPNKELMQEFEKALKDKSFGYVAEIINNSRKMLKATVAGNTEIIVKILHEIHNSEIPILQYNDENSLSCVVNLAYLSARDTYRVEREEKTGKGYADFTFHPKRQIDTAFIIELKKDEVADVAINQIKEKEYVEKFKNKYNHILAVAICYDSKTKEHECKIESIK